MAIADDAIPTQAKQKHNKAKELLDDVNVAGDLLLCKLCQHSIDWRWKINAMAWTLVFKLDLIS